MRTTPSPSAQMMGLRPGQMPSSPLGVARMTLATGPSYMRRSGRTNCTVSSAIGYSATLSAASMAAARLRTSSMSLA